MIGRKTRASTWADSHGNLALAPAPTSDASPPCTCGGATTLIPVGTKSRQTSVRRTSCAFRLRLPREQVCARCARRGAQDEEGGLLGVLYRRCWPTRCCCLGPCPHIVTIEANGIIHRVCVYVESEEFSAMMLLSQRFTNDASCVVAMTLGCLPTDVRFTATTSAEHVDIDVSTTSVDFRATRVRRDIPSLLLALKPSLGQTFASRHLLVNDRL